MVGHLGRWEGKQLAVRTVGHGVVVGGIVALCALGADAQADPKPSDMLKSTTVTAYNDLSYYGPADPQEVARCLSLTSDLKTLILPEYRACRAKAYPVGNRLGLSMFEVRVSLRDTGLMGEDIREIALLAATKAARDAGRKFLMRTEQHDHVNCSGTPVATTMATASGNSIYGTTTLTQSHYCSLFYTTTFVAFDDYEVVRAGVLSAVKDGKGVLDPDLYYDISDHVANTRSGDASRIENFRGHPLEPWKRYLPVNESYAAVVEKYRLREPVKVTIKAPEPLRVSEPSIEGRLAIQGGSEKR